MKFEGTQKGNPHRLTIDQHVFPRASINRFINTDGLVEVFSRNAKKVLKIKSNNNLFCAKRIWDQKTEVGIGKRIEDEFQRLVNKIQNGSVSTIGFFEKRVVEDFFSLWRSRHHFRIHGLPDLEVKGITGDSLTKDQQEILERKHTLFFRNGVMPGRFTAGIQVIRYMDAFRHDNRFVEWGIVRSAEGDFIVPDCFEDIMIVPVSPTIALMADHPNATITKRELEIVNSVAIDRSSDFYFAKKLCYCPVTGDSHTRLPQFSRYEDFSRYAAGVIR